MSNREGLTENMAQSREQVAVLVPCYSDERAIAKVVADFRAALPETPSTPSMSTIPLDRQ